MDDLGKTLTDSVRELLAGVSAHAPGVVGAIVLLIIGWVAARLLRVLAVRAIQVIETLINRVTGRPSAASLRGSATLFSAVVFWAVLLFFITAATQVLGLVTFTQWLARLLDYLPTLIAGLLIIAAGFILAKFVGDVVYAASERLAPAQRTALARLARGVALMAALLVGADQIGIRVTWIAVLVVIVLGSILGGLMLAVSLGARGYVSNLIGAHYLHHAFRIGEQVRVAGHEGRILDVTATSLVLETEAGRVVLPGRVFHEEAIVLIAGPDGG